MEFSMSTLTGAEDDEAAPAVGLEHDDVDNDDVDDDDASISSLRC